MMTNLMTWIIFGKLCDQFFEKNDPTPNKILKMHESSGGYGGIPPKAPVVHFKNRGLWGGVPPNLMT